MHKSQESVEVIDDKQANTLFTQTLSLKCTWRQVYTRFILYQGR